VSAPRPVADHEVHRILAMVPWLVANPGTTTSEVAARFGVPVAQVERDVDLVLMVGVPPYTPDTYIDISIDDDGRIDIRLGDFFLRPPRLSPAEGLALLAAGRALLAVPGSDPSGPLSTALAKLEAALDMPDLVVDLHEPPFLQAVRSAAEAGHSIEIDYWSAGRDVRTTRRVDPYTVFYAEGEWYLLGFCHLAGDQRAFRVDRIRGVEVVGETFEPPPAADVPDVVFRPDRADTRVVLDLAPAAAWVAEAFPVEAVEERRAGRLRVTLAVSERAWLERLLLRLGRDARVVGPAALRATASDAARRVLARYDR
jgi:proteasome accessory factor C